MSDSQGPGGALEPHPSWGFGPPPPTGKHPYSPPTSIAALATQNGLTDLSSAHHPHLTLLKSSSSNNHSIGLPPSWLPTADSEGLGGRLSDTFSEMRYLELNNWDLSSSYPTAEGLTARLVDSRSIDSPDHPIQYRPWEKPDSSSNGPTTTSSPTTGTNSNTTTTTTNGASSRNDNVTTTSTANGVSSTNNDNENKTPPTLTPLTNAFPNFPDTFVQNGQKLPSFQSQFNSFTDSPLTGHITHHLAVTEAPASGLPSFHTLPANGRYIPTHPTGQLHPVPHPGHPHMIAASPMPPPRDQQPFLEERHIQLFPGQVPLAPGQFSQLIATSGPATSTMTITNGHHIHSPHAYHPVMTNGSGTINGGGPFGGVSASSTTPTAVMTQGTTTLQLQELVPVPPMHTILHPSSAAAAAVAAVASSSSTHKLAQTITTDGSIPGLNLNIIDPHHPHSHAQHPHHFATANGNNHHLSLNLPKYLTGASNSDGPIETHLIAVKLPNATYEHVTPGHPGMLAHPQHPQSQSLHPPHTTAGGAQPHHPQHHPHPITKLDHHQRSPQIIPNGVPNGASPAPANNTNGQSNGGTPATPNKRQGKRKRNENANNGISNNTNGHLGQHNNHHVDSGNNAHQVSSVSSTESSFKRPNLGSNHHGKNGNGINGNGHTNVSLGDGVDHGLDKPVKKKRKRCGECTGCQRKDNCGECAPCRNDKSHQICKQRRCDKLTEKKTPKSKLKQQQQQQQQQQLQQHH